MIEYENLSKLNKPFVDGFRKGFEEILESGRYILDSHVQKFEEAFAQYCIVDHCVGTGNGMDALTIALKSFRFKAGSEVIVPSNTYIATIFSILNCNLVPVLVEPDIITYNINPNRIRDSITRRTVAIMVVHLYGKCCAMDEILPIASEFGIKIIEDCAHAHGAMFKNKKAGTFGDLGAFSFYPTKNLGALGDGGCLTTNDEALAGEVRMIRNYGSRSRNHHEIIGVNSRLDELQAAFLNVKLKSLSTINDHKRSLASIYSRELHEQFVRPSLADDYFDVYHIYNIRHPKREALRQYLFERGINTEIHYPVPPHFQKALGSLFSGESFPISEEIHSTTLSLPISLIHSRMDISRVVEIMNGF